MSGLSTLVCNLIRTCVQCSRVPGCVWALIYQEAGRCVRDDEQVDAPSTGVVRYGGFCNDPECSQTVAVGYINWSIVGFLEGGLSFGGTIVFGGIFIGIFIWCQQRHVVRYQRLGDPQVADGFAPAAVRYNRRQEVVRLLEEFQAEQGNDEDLALGRRVVRALGRRPIQPEPRIPSHRVEPLGLFGRFQRALRGILGAAWDRPEEIQMAENQGGPNIIVQGGNIPPDDGPAILVVDQQVQVPDNNPPQAPRGDGRGGRVQPARNSKTTARGNLRRYFGNRDEEDAV